MSNPCPIQTFMNVFFFIFLALYPQPMREEEPSAPNKPGLQLLSRLYQWMTSPQDTHRALDQETPKTAPDADFFPLPPGATTVQQYLQPAVIILAACVVVVLLLGYCMCAAGRTEESRKRKSRRCPAVAESWSHWLQSHWRRSLVILMALATLASVPWEFVRMYQNEVAKKSSVLISVSQLNPYAGGR